MSKTHKIAVLAGDGIGPEVMAVGLDLLNAAAEKFGFAIDAKDYAVGGAAIDRFGDALPPHTLAGCRDAQAIFFGSIGGPNPPRCCPCANPSASTPTSAPRNVTQASSTPRPSNPNGYPTASTSSSS